MSETSIDQAAAGAEARLDRLEQESAGNEDAELQAAGLALDESMHIEDHPASLDDDVLASGAAVSDAELADCVQAFSEAFNARDLDSLLELVTDDCETPGLGTDIGNLPDALEDLWERRPSCCLTCAEHDGRDLSVMWELGDGGAWWRLAVVHFADVEDCRLGVVEFSEDPTLLDEVVAEPPDLDLEEGARWEEWSEGAVEER